jgi:hypothetical protein
MVRSAQPKSADHPYREPRRVRLPGFLAEDPVGLGDAIKRATSAVGIKPCGGCARRAEALNRRVQFTGRMSHRSL